MPGCALREMIAPTPLLPAQIATNAAVMIEDHLEDPELDAKDSSPIEVLADVVNTPSTVFWSAMVMYAATAWTLTEWIVGYEPDLSKRLAQMQRWIGPRLASAPPPHPSPPSPTPNADDWRRTPRGQVRY